MPSIKRMDRCLRLDHQLCFPMYAASKEIIRKYTPYLKEIDLTYTQYIVMLVLWEQERISMRELGERLYLDSGTLTPLLVKLEKKGLLVRERSKTDERIMEITATDKGIGLKVKSRKIPKEIGKCLNLSPKEAYELSKILKKILKNTTE